jgi:hypothetical protein
MSSQYHQLPLVQHHSVFPPSCTTPPLTNHTTQSTTQPPLSGNHLQQDTPSAVTTNMPSSLSTGSTNTRNVTELQIRTPHVELPIFTGEAPRAWLLEC